MKKPRECLSVKAENLSVACCECNRGRDVRSQVPIPVGGKVHRYQTSWYCSLHCPECSHGQGTLEMVGGAV